MRPGPSGPMRPGWLERPARSRLSPDHPLYDEVLARHARACASGMSSYLDPISRFSVLTARYLADRGYCCSVGCRHCPWTDVFEDLDDREP
ncbi:MAG: DUF5522 domain-containing protein [Acidimicrobiales bacterium]